MYVKEREKGSQDIREIEEKKENMLTRWSICWAKLALNTVMGGSAESKLSCVDRGSRGGITPPLQEAAGPRHSHSWGHSKKKDASPGSTQNRRTRRRWR